MAVINIERRPRELGRVRMGDKGAKGQPQRLANFRLTSADESLLQAAARLYGGEVRPWAGKPGEFELYTQKNELPCFVAPQEVSQWYELWSAGGCQRRCDSATATVADKLGNLVTVSCLCDAAKPECKLVTRLNVMLADLPGIGVWRLETSSYYAAQQLPAAVDIVLRLQGRGSYTAAYLAIEEKTVVRGGKTKKFPVPVLRIRETMASLMSGQSVRELPSGETVDTRSGEVRPANGNAPALDAPAPALDVPARVAGAMEQTPSFAGATLSGTPSDVAMKNLLDDLQAEWTRQDLGPVKVLAVYGRRALGRALTPQADPGGRYADFATILNDLRARPWNLQSVCIASQEAGINTHTDHGAVHRAWMAKIVGVDLPSRNLFTTRELGLCLAAAKAITAPQDDAPPGDAPDDGDAADLVLEADLVPDKPDPFQEPAPGVSMATPGAFR